MPAQRPAVELPSEVKPIGILGILGLLVRAAIAYVLGFALYIGAFQLSRKLSPLLPDQGLLNFALFIVIGIFIAACCSRSSSRCGRGRCGASP